MPGFTLFYWKKSRFAHKMAWVSESPAWTSCVMDGWEAVHELGLVWGCDVLIGQLVGPTEPLISDLTQQPFGVLQALVPVFSPCCADRAGRSCRDGDDSLKLMGQATPRAADPITGAVLPRKMALGRRKGLGALCQNETGITSPVGSVIEQAQQKC